MNDPKSFSAQNAETPESTPKSIAPNSSLAVWNQPPTEGISPAKPAADASPDSKVATLIAEKAVVVAKKVSQVVGHTADRLSEGRDRLVSASRRSPQGAALTMLGVGIGTGIGCGILISSLIARSRRKNRTESPLAD